MKRILWLLLFLCFALAPAPVWAETNAENAPQIAAQGAALVDGRTGRVLWEKDGDTPMTMASTTKILTAVLVLENADLDRVGCYCHICIIGFLRASNWTCIVSLRFSLYNNICPD